MLDLVRCTTAIAAGDDAGWWPRPAGPVLPEDAYEDWAIDARRQIGAAVASARRRLAAEAACSSRWDEVAEHARAMLEVDEFDERAHELLVRALAADGRHGEARVAADPVPGLHGGARNRAAGAAVSDVTLSGSEDHESMPRPFGRSVR